MVDVRTVCLTHTLSPVGGKSVDRAPRRVSPGGALTLAGWLIGAVLTVVVLSGVELDFGRRNQSAHLVLNTLDACVALLVAYLLYGRWVRARSMQYLLLVQGFVLLAVAGLGLGPAIRATVGDPSGGSDVWLPTALRVVGAILILAAALLPRQQAVGRTSWRPELTVPGAVVAGLWLLFWRVGRGLPTAIADVTPTGRPVLMSAHPLLLAGQALSAACFLLASLAFAEQGARRRDELLVWLGPACALVGFSRLHYMLFPSLYTDRIYTGDLLRTACYLVLIVGAVRELKQYGSARERVAVLDDRRRLARELHDGVVQELAFIRAESHSIPSGLASRSRILEACDRALDEARAAIQALGRPGDEPLGFMLHRAAQELAERYGIELEVDVDDSITARAEQKHALLRIAREAVSNAVRHGNAHRLSVSLCRDGDRQQLMIRDDGGGFDPARTVSAPGGYGLTSMRDRAQALPGSFDVRAERGAGTQVTVTW